jgi:hypothetical protein
MKFLFKLLGIAIIFAGSIINALSILASLQGKDSIGASLGGGIFIALGVSIIVINRKGYAW